MIPADSILWSNMHSVLYDEAVFEDPYKFNPERYLTGDVKLKKQRTIPFMIGEWLLYSNDKIKRERFSNECLNWP